MRRQRLVRDGAACGGSATQKVPHRTKPPRKSCIRRGAPRWQGTNQRRKAATRPKPNNRPPRNSVRRQLMPRHSKQSRQPSNNKSSRPPTQEQLHEARCVRDVQRRVIQTSQQPREAQGHLVACGAGAGRGARVCANQSREAWRMHRTGAPHAGASHRLRHVCTLHTAVVRLRTPALPGPPVAPASERPAPAAAHTRAGAGAGFSGRTRDDARGQVGEQDRHQFTLAVLAVHCQLDGLQDRLAHGERSGGGRSMSQEGAGVRSVQGAACAC